MRRGVAKLTGALAVALLGNAGAAQAQSLINIIDPSQGIVERSTGVWVTQIVVWLPGGPPTDADVTVDWTLIPGSATHPEDFVNASLTGTLTFRKLVDSTLNINLEINGDDIDEWTLPQTYHQDEVFFVELSNPSPNASIQKGRATVTLIDDDRAMPGLQFLAAVSGNSVTANQNTLLWRNPAPKPDDILIRWNSGSGCAPPTSTTEPLSGPDAGQGRLVADFLQTINGPGAVQSWNHGGRQLDTQYCYSLWTLYAGSPTPNTDRMMVTATPFNSSLGRIAWRYTPGCYEPWPCANAVLAPPTVGFDAIYTVDNSGVVHAMKRGDNGGGVWPPGWAPLSLGKPTQSRSPVIPIDGTWRLVVGTDGGGLHAIDAQSGHLVWSRSAAFGNALPNLAGGSPQAPPAGLFKAFGGQNDMLLVGTNNGLGNNAFFALHPATGLDLGGGPFTDPLMGNVTGMAVVDYALPNRVFFLTSAPNETLYALDTGPMGSPGLTPSTLGWNPKPFGGSSGAPVMRGGRIYLGDSSSQIHALHLGGTSYSEPTNNGLAKGYLWPDRRDDRLYVSTDGKVHGFRDTGSMLDPLWSVDVNNPSVVLQKPGTDFLFVGNSNGELVQISAFDQFVRKVPLDPGFQIGSPSLDGVNDILVVGSLTGTIHAVRIPLP
jgi:outer membrane protein assembly factor BamB